MNSKEKIAIPAQIMPTRDPKERAKCFDEVPLGYTEEMAVAEASRCLNCNTLPCVRGCPININIPKFLNLTMERNFVEAVGVIRESNYLPSICGRVCPQESQCQKECTIGRITSHPISIGNIERFLADNFSDELPSVVIPPKTGRKIAVAGSGPGGLTCASDLVKSGHSVTIFEALHEPGGVLAYGIPEFRLPKTILKKEIDSLKKMGVEFKMNTIIGKTITVEEILRDYDALFIGTGAGVPTFPGIKGEDLPGAYSANEYLTRVNLMRAWEKDARTPVTVGKTTIVVGGGNVAMDAARTALRLGSKRVIVAYRRLESDMPAKIEEVSHAKEEGIEFKFLISPVEILEDENGRIGGTVFRRMRIEKDPQGGRNKIFETDETFLITNDVIIFATGTSPNPTLTSNCLGLKLDKYGGVVVNPETMQTNIPKIFAGGDSISSSSTVIMAMSNGKTAAKGIDKFLKSQE